MADATVLERIAAWEAAGLIDQDTAQRLRAAETSAAPALAWAQPMPATTPRWLDAVSGITASELFAYIGAAFALASWYAFVVMLVGDDNTLGTAGGVLIAAIALVGSARMLMRGYAGAVRGAGIALAVAVPNVAAAVWIVLSDRVDPELNGVLTATAAVVAAFAFRAWRPAVTTQLALALATVSLGINAMSMAEALLFPSGIEEPGGSPGDPSAALLRVVLTLAGWWLIALAMAVVLVIADRGPDAAPRHWLGRFVVGLTVVGGTAAAVTQRYDWNAAGELAGIPVLAPAVGAAVVLAASGALVALALNRSASAYLWPGAIGVWSALTWLNAEYVADEAGLWAALLAEALVLFAVAWAIRSVRGRLRGAPPAAPSLEPAG